MDDAVLSIECLAKLGLGKQPFTSSVEGFIYTDPALDMPVNVTLEHLRDRATPVLIKGERGIGKTTLLQRLQAKAPGDLHFCPIESGADISMAAVDYCIRLQWQPRPAHGDPRKLSIDRYLFALMHDDVRPVLVLDDAHLLEPQVLAGLLELKREMRAEYGEQLGLVLSAEPSIEAKLNRIAESSDLVSELYTVVLRPLNRDQIRAYIEHRLRAAGASRVDLSDDDLVAVQSESGGLPGELNLAACHALETRCGGGISRRRARPGRGSNRLLVPAAIGVLVVGVLAVLIAILGGLLDEPEPALQEIALAVPPPEPPSSPEPDEAPDEIEPEVRPLAPTAPALPSSDQPVAVAPTIEVTPPPTPPATTSAEPEPEPEPRIVAPTPEPPAPQPSAAVDPEPAAAGLRGPDWLLAQDPELFTVQILGVGSAEALRRYFDSHRFSDAMAYYRTMRSGKPWYVLLEGSYPNADAARAAIASFPPEIRRNQPWIRRIGDLQSAAKP